MIFRMPVRSSRLEFRARPEMVDAVKRAAIDDGRTVSAWIEKVLTDRLVERGYFSR